MPILRWFGLQVGHVLAVDADRPAVGVFEAGDHAQRRRLAAARRAEERDELALVDRDVEVLDDLIGAEDSC